MFIQSSLSSIQSLFPSMVAKKTQKSSNHHLHHWSSSPCTEEQWSSVRHPFTRESLLLPPPSLTTMSKQRQNRAQNDKSPKSAKKEGMLPLPSPHSMPSNNHHLHHHPSTIHPSSSPSTSSSSFPIGVGPPVVDSFSSSSGGSASPSLSLRTATAEDSLSTLGVGIENGMLINGDGATAQQINLQIFVPELQMQKCFSVPLDELVWDIKRRLLESLPQQLPQYFNFGLFLPPCDGRAGKFLLEDRPIRDYPFHDCVPYVELKYKKRVYKMLRLDEKALRSVHSKSNLRKLADAIQQKNAQKVERLCTQGLDPNFHDAHGETPLTLASGIPGNREVLVQLVGGGAHLDFRNTEGQTGMHKAAFLSVADNVRTLLELGASPNYRDLIGLTPLYYNMLSTDSNPEVAEMLLAEAADLQVVDMHGNTALHQACKNGLAKHVEQLIFYGADMNARNVNGNSPLHVCAVNGRVDCAQVLLYRGANPGLMNRQNQTAIHVAQIVGNLPVVDVIRGHTPQNIVPFRETPKLNPRRRLSSRQFSIQDGQIRRRSLSHCSSSSSTIASQSQNRFSSANVPNHYQGKISPSPSMSSSVADYGTLRRIPAESVQHQQPGFESNIARILVIPRGPKGFGFILRGARHVDSMQLEFHPTPAIPALQFFEGVDMQGMAMRAGLRPGDFLLEINGVDVRSASHEQVVQLIHQSGDTITLKVITVDLEQPQPKQQQIYAAAGIGANYATIGRRNHSVPRGNNPMNGPGGTIPPPPPQRNPSTTLSFGRGSIPQQFCTADLPPPSSAQHNNIPNPPPQPTNSHQIRCASVKLSRNSAVRRISAAELEHLMVQQGSSQQSILLGPEQQQNVGGPKKFTSLAEMKRRKQPPIRANSISDDQNGLYGQSMLKNSTSSPDLPNDSMENGNNRRHLLRPKTPPPPPPPIGQRQNIINGGGEEEENQQQTTIYASATIQQNDTKITMNEQPAPIAQCSNSAPNPPPPPPPPPNLLNRPNQPSTSTNGGRSPPTKGPTENDCRGVSEQALRSVRLKPVPTKNAVPIQQNNTTKCSTMEKSTPAKFVPPTNFDSDLRSALAKRRSKVRGAEEGSESGNEEIVSQNHQHGEKKKDEEEERKVVNILVEGNGTTTNVGRYNSGLSLRESVLENVTKSVGQNEGSSHKMAPNTSSHSPPGGFIGTKKDSGYTSSRTSLEPSECGDCVENNNNGHQHIHSSPQCCLPVKHRVNQMDPCPPSTSSPLPGLAPKPAAHSKCHQHQRIIPASNNHSHALSSSSSLSPLVRIPPIDYDQSEGSQTSTDSGNQTDFEQQPGFSRTTIGGEEEPKENGRQNESNRDERTIGQFRQKPISEWKPRDVNEWLEELGLREHCAAFENVCGHELLHFDRTRYTALGVTRVGDRQRMEQSLKEFMRE